MKMKFWHKNCGETNISQKSQTIWNNGRRDGRSLKFKGLTGPVGSSSPGFIIKFSDKSVEV